MTEGPFTIVWVSSADDLKRKLALLRLRHKLSIRQLQEAAGVSYGTIWGWEQPGRGRYTAGHVPSAESLLRVQEVYRVFFRWKEDGDDQGAV